MNTEAGQHLPEQEIVDAFPVNLVIEEVVNGRISDLIDSTPDLKALRSEQWKLNEDDMENLSIWLTNSDDKMLLPDAQLFRKLINHVFIIYTSDKEGVKQAQEWINIMANKWEISPVKLSNMFKWMLKNRINHMRNVTEETLTRFISVFVLTARAYPDLRKEFVYLLPSSVTSDDKLQLATQNILTMQTMFNVPFLSNKSVFKAPIEGADYYIAIQYGLAESTHGIYLALGRENSSSADPMQGVVMRIGLDTQDDVMRINLVQGIKVQTPDTITEMFLDAWMDDLSEGLFLKLIDKIGKYLDKKKDRDLINELGNEMSSKYMEEMRAELGMHPADALGYIALRIAQQGHVKIDNKILRKAEPRFKALLGIVTENLVTRKNGNPSINPMVRYNKLGLRKSGAIAKAPEGYGRWQTMQHLTDNLLPARLASEDEKANNVQTILNVFDNFEEIPVNLFHIDLDRNDGLPRSTTVDDVILSGKKAVGGIDLDSNNLNLRVKGDIFNFELPDDFEGIDIDVQGFLPVIINISPIINMPFLLGVADKEEYHPQLTYSLN